LAFGSTIRALGHEFAETLVEIDRHGRFEAGAELELGIGRLDGKFKADRFPNDLAVEAGIKLIEIGGFDLAAGRVWANPQGARLVFTVVGIPITIETGLISELTPERLLAEILRALRPRIKMPKELTIRPTLSIGGEGSSAAQGNESHEQPAKRNQDSSAENGRGAEQAAQAANPAPAAPAATGAPRSGDRGAEQQAAGLSRKHPAPNEAQSGQATAAEERARGTATTASLPSLVPGPYLHRVEFPEVGPLKGCAVLLEQDSRTPEKRPTVVRVLPASAGRRLLQKPQPVRIMDVPATAPAERQLPGALTVDGDTVDVTAPVFALPKPSRPVHGPMHVFAVPGPEPGRLWLGRDHLTADCADQEDPSVIPLPIGLRQLAPEFDPARLGVDQHELSPGARRVLEAAVVAAVTQTSFEILTPWALPALGRLPASAAFRYVAGPAGARELVLVSSEGMAINLPEGHRLATRLKAAQPEGRVAAFVARLLALGVQPLSLWAIDGDSFLVIIQGQEDELRSSLQLGEGRTGLPLDAPKRVLGCAFGPAPALPRCAGFAGPAFDAPGPAGLPDLRERFSEEAPLLSTIHDELVGGLGIVSVHFGRVPALGRDLALFGRALDGSQWSVTALERVWHEQPEPPTREWEVAGPQLEVRVEEDASRCGGSPAGLANAVQRADFLARVVAGEGRTGTCLGPWELTKTFDQ
jgi:hypothetical protein